MRASSRRLTLIGSATAALLVLAGCAGADDDTAADEASASPSPVEEMAEPTTEAEETVAAEEPAAETASGGYIEYASYTADPASYAAAGDVVLFFSASWCPTCQAADGNLSESDFPNDLTVVTVDYDENTDLRQQYGVTVQHTFVQVDEQGNELAKWTGSTTVDQIAGQVV